MLVNIGDVLRQPEIDFTSTQRDLKSVDTVGVSSFVSDKVLALEI